MQVTLVLFGVCFLFSCVYGMSRAQMKKAGAIMKKSCMPKNNVNEDQVGSIESGKFIEEKDVMCYVACIYTINNVVKNNKINLEALMKQVDLMFPEESKAPVKAAAVSCKDIGKKYKDICEAAYWTAKCMYDYDPKNFFFP